MWQRRTEEAVYYWPEVDQRGTRKAVSVRKANRAAPFLLFGQMPESGVPRPSGRDGQKTDTPRVLGRPVSMGGKRHVRGDGIKTSDPLARDRTRRMEARHRGRR